ncbi:MAG: hypothetical protein BMS9Abin28_0161 [Anaerolineae bacterium]|nr:MAG: hypothetical protein BMS9Abin28_0161 [Anaerolineae bacterium]
MTRRHPFLWISDLSQKRVLIATAALSIGLMVSLAGLNGPLRTEAAPAGIVSYELAGDVATANEILESWGATGRAYAGISLGLDFLFLFTYAIAIGLACVLLADRLTTRATFLSALGIWLAWGMVAAGAFDFVENYGLIRVLICAEKSWWPVIARWSAIFKFILIGIGLSYLVVGFISLQLRREQ